MTPTELALSIMAAQHAKGLANYGTTLDDANLSLLQLLRHQAEELADYLVYLEAQFVQHWGFDTEGLSIHESAARRLVEYPDLSHVRTILLNTCECILELEQSQSPVPVHTAPAVRTAEEREGSK